MRTTTAPYTESRLAHLIRNKCVGFPVVEQVETTSDAERGSTSDAMHKGLNVICNKDNDRQN